MFLTERAAIAAIKSQGPERVKPGDILVLICRGPMGAGMEEIYQITSALKHLSFGKHVAVLTDARFSGVSTGACIGHVGPEALAGGPIGKVRDGDRIQIVIDRNKLEGTVDLVGEGDHAVGPDEGTRILAEPAAARRPRPRPAICPTTRACGRRCSASAAAPGAAACTTWTRSCAHSRINVAGTLRVPSASATAHGVCLLLYRMSPFKRSTPPGEHRPVLLDAVLHLLDPQPGQVAVDCTVGWAGHSAEILRRLGPTGLLIGLDWDADNLPNARARLAEVGFPFVLEHANFAALPTVLATHGREQVDMVLADLGMSCMQVDDPERGFSYRRDGPLDMRMDRTRGKSAAELLAAIAEPDLAKALWEYGDEEQAEMIARAIVDARTRTPLDRTSQLAKVVQEATRQTEWRLRTGANAWVRHPAARTFQALRIVVNRELAQSDPPAAGPAGSPRPGREGGNH